MALVIAIGVNADGERKILGLVFGASEEAADGKELLHSLSGDDSPLWRLPAVWSRRAGPARATCYRPL